jgi:flagellar FliL protein
MLSIKAGSRRQRILLNVYRGLLICLILIGLVIVAGTIYGLFFNTKPVDREVPGKSGEGQPFTGIGRLRVPTADPEPGTVVLFVLFIYYPDDKAFSEELVFRVRNFRDIIVDYIGSFSVAELHELDDEIMKNELLSRFNAILRLGQLETLYFTDFMVVG